MSSHAAMGSLVGGTPHRPPRDRESGRNGMSSEIRRDHPNHSTGSDRGVALPRRRWEQDAACRVMHPEVFFPCRQSLTLEVARACAICAQCRVRRDCAIFALQHSVVCGIFAGVYLGADGSPNPGALRSLRDIADSVGCAES
ncbi:WhiB family transcriptional regulator [Nocardia otitidiscaviarum]|uniref:WhiB family transcriptional regulator n=1 Tax=Nocardia otitidiscaviarum TaxID=1823 RepID=A0A516NSL4_9NOCA|nr:WhiB family transcriptional regulator [Nocardia otitidiscaviarum]